MRMSRLFVIGIVLVAMMCLPLGGCSATPRQQYRIAAVTYDATAIGLAVAKPKIDAATWQKIQDDEALARQRLATAQKWLFDNSALADMAGAPFPPLDPLNITLEILSGYLKNVQLVSPEVPASPATTAPAPTAATPSEVTIDIPIYITTPTPILVAPPASQTQPGADR